MVLDIIAGRGASPGTPSWSLPDTSAAALLSQPVSWRHGCPASPRPGPRQAPRAAAPPWRPSLAGRHFLALSWVPDRRDGFSNHGWTWVFLLAPAPELWLLHDRDEAFKALKAQAQGDQTRRWGLELKGARLEAVEGDPRERWLGLRFQRRALTGRMEQTRLSFQAIPGRGGLRLDGTDPLTLVRMGLGQPFPATAPEPLRGAALPRALARGLEGPPGSGPPGRGLRGAARGGPPPGPAPRLVPGPGPADPPGPQAGRPGPEAAPGADPPGTLRRGPRQGPRPASGRPAPAGEGEAALRRSSTA